MSDTAFIELHRYHSNNEILLRVGSVTAVEHDEPGARVHTEVETIDVRESYVDVVHLIKSTLGDLDV